MTDTDDTDELLLIPPDFFVVESDSGHSETKQPYYNIVNKLIKQVDSLQNRLNSIESSESNLSKSFDNWNCSLTMNNPKPNFRKYNSTDDLRTSYSVQNTPQKPISKFRLNSLPNSPNVDRFYNTRKLRDIESKLVNDSSPDKVTRDKDGVMLHEIDTFLSKVKTIQRINAARNLEHDFNNYGRVKDEKKIQINNSDEPVTKQSTWQCGDNKESVPDYGIGIRDLLYNNKDTIPEHPLNNNSNDQDMELKYSSYITESPPSFEHKHSSDTSSDTTHVTAYNRHKSNKGNLINNPIHSNAVNILNMHKKLLEDNKKSAKDSSRERRKKSKTTVVEDNVSTDLGLMNLADIWNSNTYSSLNTAQLSQKLQEEKYRRQHCENLIQELQTRNLEMQQKLSVAVKVDEAKNKTIQQFQDALEKIIDRLEKLNKEKLDQEYELNVLKNKQIDDKEEIDQKISYYEKEASKALSLAHTNQEKSNTLEKKCVELEIDNHTMVNKLKSLEENYSKECEKYKRISDILAQKELEINENKHTLSSAKSEISQSKKSVESCQKEFNKIKEDYLKLDEKLKEERMQTVKLNKEIMDLLEEIESRKKNESELKNEICKLKEKLDSSKLELRNFYQGQVEILVQNKLKEFQSQLDQTENNFKEEIKKREMAIAKSAALHIQQISEKYALEIKLLEKKHQEEIKLYKIQVMQHKQQVENVQNKMEQFQDKRISLAKQLQKVMEYQWHEAMRIITSGKSPTFQDETTFSTIDQLNSLKTKSYNNLEEILSQHNDDELVEPKKKVEQEDIASATNSNDKPAFDRFGQLVETPVSSRTQVTKPVDENELQKYIRLLLNKPMDNASYPVQEDHAMYYDNFSIDGNRASYFLDKEDGSKTYRAQHRDRKGLKPPWK